MKRWAVGLITGLLTVGLAWTYHQTAFSVLQKYLTPDLEDPVPTLQLIQRNYRLLVLAEGELTGLKTTPVVTPEVRRIPESDISGISVGSPVQVTVNAMPEKSFSGRVATLAATSRQVSRKDPRKYFECQIDLDVPTEILNSLKPRMRAQGQIQTEVKEQHASAD